MGLAAAGPGQRPGRPGRQDLRVTVIRTECPGQDDQQDGFKVGWL